MNDRITGMFDEPASKHQEEPPRVDQLSVDV